MLWDELPFLREGDEIIYRHAARAGGGLDTGRVVGFTAGAVLIPSAQFVGVKITILAQDITAVRRFVNGVMEQIDTETTGPRRFSSSALHPFGTVHDGDAHEEV
jgi:hypothetical protein